MVSATEWPRTGSARVRRLDRGHAVIVGRSFLGGIRGQTIGDRADGRRPIRDELEQGFQFAGTKNLGDSCIDIAEKKPATAVADHPLQSHEIAQGGGTRKAHSAQIDDQIRPAISLEMQFVVFSQILNRRGSRRKQSQNSATKIPFTL